MQLTPWMAFHTALHAALALDLGALLASDADFERLWKQPRRFGLAISMRALAAGGLARVALRGDHRRRRMRPVVWRSNGQGSTL